MKIWILLALTLPNIAAASDSWHEGNGRWCYKDPAGRSTTGSQCFLPDGAFGVECQEFGNVVCRTHGFPPTFTYYREVIGCVPYAQCH